MFNNIIFNVSIKYTATKTNDDVYLDKEEVVWLNVYTSLYHKMFIITTSR